MTIGLIILELNRDKKSHHKTISQTYTPTYIDVKY